MLQIYVFHSKIALSELNFRKKGKQTAVLKVQQPVGNLSVRR